MEWVIFTQTLINVSSKNEENFKSQMKLYLFSALTKLFPFLQTPKELSKRVFGLIQMHTWSSHKILNFFLTINRKVWLFYFITQVNDYTGRVKVRIHAVDDKKFKAHPFCLIGDKCNDGVYIEDHDITPDKNEW